MRRFAPSASDHRLWLALTDAEGPFLSIPELRRVAPQGITTLDARRAAALKAAKASFEVAWDARGAQPDAFFAARDTWVDHVLTRTFGWGEFRQPAPASARVSSPDGQVTVTASFAYVAGGTPRALVLVVPPSASLREAPGDGWSADQVDRLAALLLEAKVPLGVVTDGRWWGLVRAVPGTTVASGVIDSQTWVEEPGPRDAFAALLSPRHLSQGAPEQLLDELFKNSVTAAEDVTEALGAQVRQAIELLVASFSETSLSARERGQADPLPEPDVVYDAAVTVMMRVVFLLFAQERGLLPTGPLFEQGYGLVGQVDALRDRAEAETPEALEGTALVWYRLLATSKALYEGATFENMRLPAYGGSLFAPDRFGFLTATRPDGAGLACAVNDRVMLAVLEAVQFANVPGQGERQISFRDIDVEQIGYIYEGLLGYTCRRASETIVGLIGKAGCEPEIPLSVLNDLADDAGDDADLARRIIAWVKDDQPAAVSKSASALAKALGASDGLIEDAEVALRSVTHDPELSENLRSFLGAIRRDLRGRPVVVQEGGLLVAETPSRRNAGAHYTPRSLAEEVVHYALEPLVYNPGPYQTDDHTAWRLKSSAEIVGLKVADIACGSGAFLVAAARYLGGKLVEAWAAEGIQGEPARLERRAIRAVVASCLYGADINPMAIEMCKLSLWLVSLDARLPFSFVDDKVLVGNSLLGLTDVGQLRALHIDPSRASGHQDLLTMAGAITSVDIDARLARAAQLRRDLAHPVNDDDPMQSTRRKRALSQQLDAVLADLRTMGDAVIAAGLIHGGKPGKALDQAYQALRTTVTDAFPASGDADRTNLDAVLEKGLTPTVDTDYERWQPIHWPVELADVFEERHGRRGGFDAIVGNPPFLGGQKITGAMGTEVRDWFVNTLAGGTKGSADLVAYFFLRAFSLLRDTGTLGLIATNTVAQGDTREVGLDRLEAAGFTITRCKQSEKWPARAGIEHAAVWGSRGPVSDAVARVADRVPVRRITTLLEPAGRATGRPERLAENVGIAFQGCIVLGLGFVIEEEEARAWIAEDPRNAEVLFPYLNGEDLNSRPDASGSRWVIDFNDRSEAAARQYAEPFARVLRAVKPERRRTKPDGTFVLRKPLPDRWWQYGEKRPGMRSAICDLDEVLAIARVSKTVMPMRVTTGQVPSEQTAVFATSSFADQAALSSSAHTYWAVAHGSAMRNDTRYTPSSVFETFPRPKLSDGLDTIGRVLDTERREMMLRRNLGLTKLYNLVNDPHLPAGMDADVDRLRQIHVELDHTVMAAYGWGDVELDHGFHTYRQMTRWTVCPAARVEILDRLLEENHRRAALQGEVAPAASEEDDFEGDE